VSRYIEREGDRRVRARRGKHCGHEAPPACVMQGKRAGANLRGFIKEPSVGVALRAWGAPACAMQGKSDGANLRGFIKESFSFLQGQRCWRGAPPACAMQGKRAGWRQPLQPALEPSSRNISPSSGPSL
jgi:hypothetical protein